MRKCLSAKGRIGEKADIATSFPARASVILANDSRGNVIETHDDRGAFKAF
jgi:hypothetical protein